MANIVAVYKIVTRLLNQSSQWNSVESLKFLRQCMMMVIWSTHTMPTYGVSDMLTYLQ